jgi:hypothetical protein
MDEKTNIEPESCVKKVLQYHLTEVKCLLESLILFVP